MKLHLKKGKSMKYQINRTRARNLFVLLLCVMTTFFGCDVSIDVEKVDMQTEIEQEEKEKQQQEEESRKKAEEEEKEKQQQEEEARKKAEEEEKEKQQQEEEARKKAEEEEKEKQQQEEEARKKAEEEEKEKLQQEEAEKNRVREWTYLFYMAADNELEQYAISDLHEMELSGFDVKNNNVLVLVDRNPGFDSSNGDWSSTKLYKLKTGKDFGEFDLQSEEIDCSSLGLKKGNNKELDMADYNNLAKSLEFVLKEYKSNHYGLVLWGQSEGWNGFAYDESSKSKMSLPQLKKGLKKGLGDKKLDFIIFDTCFGAEIEVMYQIKDFCDYGMGVEGLLGIEGWDYTELFNKIEKLNENSSQKILTTFIEEFSQEYDVYEKSSICAVKMSNLDNYFNAFDEFCKKTGLLINSKEKSKEIKNALLECDGKYFCNETKSDLYIDIDTLIDTVCNSSISSKELLSLKDKYLSERNSTVIGSWNSEGKSSSLAVYFLSQNETNTFSSRHPNEYVQGACTAQIDFVTASKGYVTRKNGSSSMMDKILNSTWG